MCGGQRDEENTGKLQSTFADIKMTGSEREKALSKNVKLIYLN